MNELQVQATRYWHLFVLDPSNSGRGYQARVLECARRFLQHWLQQRQEQPQGTAIQVQQYLVKGFARQKKTSSLWLDSDVSLCLRCYVSYCIWIACCKRAANFGQAMGITYKDLLHFVLHDDGKPIALDENGQPKKDIFVPFVYYVLASFRDDRGSLRAWTERLVRQNKEIQEFLIQSGQKITSSWAVLKRSKIIHLADPIDQKILKAFLQVYRRDRLEQVGIAGASHKIAAPSQAQLEEMVELLAVEGVTFSVRSLSSNLERLAKMLKNREIWGSRQSPVAESLELFVNEDGEEQYQSQDISYLTFNPSEKYEEMQQRNELEQFYTEKLVDCLDQGIQKGCDTQLNSLKTSQSKRRRYLASYFLSALRMFYCDGKTLGQIKTEQGLANSTEVSRMLDLRNVVLSIRQHTLEIFLAALLEKARSLGVVSGSPQADYLDNLMRHLEVFLDEKIFDEAIAELNSPTRTARSSFYSTRVCMSLNNIQG